MGTMTKFTIALVILCYLQAVFCTCLFNQCTDECPDNAPTAGQCAILFDEPKCNDDKRIVAENGGSPIPITGDLKKDAESIAVHAGCTLEIFTDEDFDNSKSFIFTAKPNKPLFIRRIEKAEDSDYDGEGLQVVDTDDLDDFHEEIECVKCTCGKRGAETGIKPTRGLIGSAINKGKDFVKDGLKSAASSLLGR